MSVSFEDGSGFAHVDARGDLEDSATVVERALSSRAVNRTVTLGEMPKAIAVHPDADPRARELHIAPQYTGVQYNPDTYL